MAVYKIVASRVNNIDAEDFVGNWNKLFFDTDGILYQSDGSTPGGTRLTPYSFKTITVSGQSDVVADSASDTLTMVAGDNITLTTSGDTVTINSTSGGTGDITAVVAGDGLTGGATTGSATVNVVGGTGITAGSDAISIDSTVTTLTGSQTLTNKTLTSPVINTGVSGTAVLDEDDMSSNSATKLATQQSIKAYVDANAGGSGDITAVVAGAGLTGGATSGSATVDVVGGTGITANANDIAIDSTVTTLTGTQTLTNKTLTAPVLSGSASAAGSILFKEDTDNGTNAVTLIGPASTADVTLTLPAATDTLVGKATTDTLSNKTLASPTMTGSLTVGSAVISEADLEQIDDLTAGTVVASKAVVVDSNKDVGTIRNLTIDGTFSDGNYTFDTSGNVSGLGTIGSGAITSTGVVIGTTVEPSGDTSAGDNAAIGYTSAEGLILTGQGSTNDVTIKNDADADVLEIPTGTTNVTVVGNVTSGGSFIIGSASMSEADLEQLDGITAGTVAASKAVVVDSNKDASSFRNLTASGTVTFGSLSDGSITATAFVDEDDMSSDSATLIPTQQSVKAYVDSNAASGDITSVVAGDGLTGGATSGAATLNVVGGTGITANSNDIAIDSTVTTLTGSQTLTNKTLTSPVINTATFGTSILPTSADGTTLGSASKEFSDLFLADGAVVSFGDDQEITLTHVADVGLTLTHTATGDNKPIILNLKSEEDDIIADEVIGTINFTAGDSSGTDAILTAAGIEAVAEDTFAADNNATKLSFKTAASEAATEKMSLSSGGNLAVAGNITMTGTDFIFEGATDDSHETTLRAIDPTADRTITLPNVTGTVSVINNTETLTNKTLTTPVINTLTAGTFEVDASVDIILDAGGADIKLKDDGTHFGRLSNVGGELVIASGSSITTALTFSGANITAAGTIGSGAITSTGVVTGTGFTIGSAAINEAELETIDGVTAGTVAASKAVVVDSNKDIGTFRNVTIDGTFSDGNYTFDTSGNVTGLGTIGSGNITSSGTIQGTTITATTAFVPDAQDGAAIGTSSLQFSDLFLADEAVVSFGDDNEITLTHVADVGLTLTHTATGDNKPVILNLKSEEDDITVGEVIGTLNFTAGDSGGTDAIATAAGIEAIAEGTFAADNNATKLSFKTAESEAATEKMSLSSAGLLTVVDDIVIKSGGTIGGANDTDLLTLGNGALTVGGTIGSGAVTSTGVVTGTGFTIGSAVINEADLEQIDDLTAGTVTASKAVVVDSNKDIGTFRNLTINGTFSDGNYTFDTSGNVTGLGTVGCGAVTSSGVVTGTGFTIGSAVINEAELETIDGITAGTVAASKAVVVDSNKDIGTFRNVTIDGTFSDGNYTFDTSGNVSGLGTVGSGAITSSGVITGTTIEATGDTSAGDNAAMGYTSAEGLILTGQGSTSDITVKNDADGTVFTVPTGTDDILFPDNAKAMWGASSDMTLYHDASNSYITNATGALKIATETSGIAVTIGHSTSEVTVADNLTVAGNLTVSGTQTVVDTVTMNAQNAVIFEGATADNFETTLTITDPTADRTITLPNVTGTVSILDNTETLSNKTLASPTMTGSLTVGSAVISEADLEQIDDLTAGTVVASKAVVVDGNKDVGTIRNLTIDGTFSDGNYTFDTSGNVSGLGTVGSGAITSSGNITSGGSFIIGSASINEAELETIDGVTAGTVAASKAVVVDSNKDIGTFRNLTIDGTFSDGNYTFDTSGNVTGLGTIGSGNITSSGTIQGTTITATTAFVPDAQDGAALGTSSLQFSDLFLADGAVVSFGDDNEITLTHSADDGLLLKHVGTGDGKEPSLTFQAGDNDIAADDVLGSIFFQAPDEGAGSDAQAIAAGIEAVSEGDFSSTNNATKLSFKTAASEAATEKMSLSSAGLLTVVDDIVIKSGGTVGGANDTDLLTLGNGALTVAGTIACNTSLTIGSAAMSEADLEQIDGITAGTAAASKALVLDSNLDIGTIRNLTINGTFSDGNYTFDTSGNVTGLGTVGCGAVTSTGVVTGTGFTIGSAVINEAELETIDGITAGTVAASKAVVVDSNKDISSFRNLTASGTVTFGSLADGTITATAFVDEDDMSSDSATLIPTQQSVKAYVDSQASGVTLTGTQTLTNKTLTAPVLSGSASAAGSILFKEDTDNGTNAVTLIGPASTGDVTLTLPAATDTLVGKATTDTLTNKTIASPTMTGSLTVGSAVISEADLEQIDDLTAGTVVASKAVVVDSNKDIGTFRNLTLSGELDAATLDISGNADIDGTTNLDVVDIDGATQIDATVTVGVDDTGHDVKFFGATSGRYLLWDESDDRLKYRDNVKAVFGHGNDLEIYHDATNSLIKSNTNRLKVLTDKYRLNNNADDASMIYAEDGADVKLYYDGSTKLATDSGGITVTGSLTIGSAAMSEADLEQLDGITAGTAAASKALVLDSNKDIGTIRNLTINGTFSDGNYTFDTSGNVTGLGTIGSGAITSTGVVVGTTIEPSGDTSAGDNAAIGYTSAEGLILTGQGSTSDVTLKNDADGTVFTVPTGTDDILFPDNAKAMWGASSDMTLYHDASNSYITNAVGALKIATETSGIAVTIGHTTSVVTIADNCTVTDTLTFGSLSDGSITATAFVDEDDMSSDSATLIPTQQSVKAYVDNEVGSAGGGDITSVVAGDGLTGGATTGAATLNVVGGTGITANANDIAIDSTVTTLTGSQTLTNKTLTSPVINTATVGTSIVPASADGATLGTASVEWSDLYLADGGIIYFGDDQEITLTHVADDGLILKHVGTGDGKEPSLTFQAGDNDIAADDVLGSIFFQAPDEGAGTDAILVAAGIEAVSEGDFAADNNATKLSFKTAASEAAAEKMSLSSGGNLDVTGDITGATLNADGDTSAGDNAAIGYTSGEGLILTGQGSTSDITVKNDADGTVFTVPTGTDDILFPDDAKAMWGDGSDLQIHHGGTHSMIKNTTGDLRIKSNSLLLKNQADNATYLDANNGGSVDLYHNNSKKFETDSGGITVTGSITIGSAAISEADLEQIDDLTAGTVVASKAVVVDSNKDVGTIRNLTIDGTFSDGNYTFDTSGNVSGLGTVGSGAITSSGVVIGTTIEPSGDTSAGDNAAIGYTSAEGLILTGQGSTSDVTLKNDADGTVFTVPTGTDDILFPDDAKAMWGAGSDMTLYHDASNSYITNATGALKIATETSGIAVTIGHSTSEVTVADNLTVTGNLTVSGTQTVVDTVTMQASNAIVFEGATADAHETTLTMVDPTADRTVTLPNATTTLVGTDTTDTLTNKTIASPTMTGSLTVGNAVISEADLEQIDDLTAGTVVASKAVVVDSNKDVGTIRNLTIDGTFSDGNYTFDTSGNVSGLGTVGSGAITSSGVVIGTTVEPSGDTSSGDNAAIGYTSAEGLILTGQGSTSDVTFKNDADTTVFTIPTGTDDILFPDSAKILLGDSSDIELYHGGTHSFLKNSTGDFRIRSNSMLLKNQADNATYIDMNNGGSVDLYHNNSKKLETDSGGITVTGSVTIGSAAMSEADLEQLDGITAGTAAASKALVLDSNKDIGTIRNLTIDGTFSDGNYTFDTSGNVTGLGTIGSGNITSSGTVQGTTITATTAFAPDAQDGAALGTSSLQFSDLFLADEAVVSFGDDNEITLTHVADVGLTLTHTATGDNTPIILNLKSEEDDIIADEVIGTLNFTAGDSGGTDAILTAAGIEAVAEDTFAADNNATKLSFKTAASEAATEKMALSSGGNLTLAGDLYTDKIRRKSDSSTTTKILLNDEVIKLYAGHSSNQVVNIESGAVTVTGTLACDTSLTIGSAAMSEADLEQLDGITAGTAAASKALVLDSNKDIGTIRNLTIDGTFSDGNYTFDTSGNVTGLGTIGSGAITSTGVVIGTTVEPSGDTSAGDNAAIGYTSAEGLILTGQGSTSDVTLKNDADGTVFTVPTGTDDILFPDNAMAMWGDGSDLKIYHGGSNSIIQEAGTGGLIIRASSLTLLGNNNSENFVVCTENGAVDIYYDGSKKFETDSGGITVTGSITIGSAAMSEADLEQIDGLTAGTVTASKAVVVDSNKDIGTFRNVTIDGTFSDGNYTFDTSGNVSGLGTVGSGAITSSGVITGTTIEATGDTSSGDNAAIGYTSAEGLILTGQGSTSDITVKNDADGTVFTVPTGTDDILFPDNAKAMWGAGSDMTLYHDASNSYITNATGALKIATETSGIAVTIGHTTSVVTIADNCTVTDTLTFGSLGDGTITVTAFVDEDNMSSDSATLIPTQQSVKAYVDSAAGAKQGYNNSGKHGQWVDGTDNYDLSQSESGLNSWGTDLADAFGINTSNFLDQMDPVGSTDTVDMGTGESNVA